MKAIIAAAGTAGHINPGIAIANKIKQEETDSEETERQEMAEGTYARQYSLHH